MTDKIIDDLSFKLLISNLNIYTKNNLELIVLLQSYSKMTKDLAHIASELIERTNELERKLFVLEHTK